MKHYHAPLTVCFRFFALIFALSPCSLIAQTNCSNYTISPEPKCVCSECGEIEPNWSLIGGSSICEGEEFEMTGAESTPLNNIETFHWYFIDNGEIVYDELFFDTTHVKYTFDVDQELPCDQTTVLLDVTLLITSADCAEGESCRHKSSSVTVTLRPEAIFDVEPQVCIDSPTQFDNNSCRANAYHWDFGDGNTSTEFSPSHQYQNPGTYTVTLTAINQNDICESLQDQVSHQVTIVGLPEAAYSYEATPQNQCEPVLINLTGTSNEWSSTSWCINPFDTLAWCLPDTTASLSDDNLEVNFKKCGKYEVIYKAINICDEVTAMDSIEIFCEPFINISSPPVACDELILDCDALNPDIEGSINSVSWVFTNASVGSANGTCFDGVVFTQNGTATLNVETPCGPLSKTVNIIIGSTAPITLSPNNPSEICPIDTMIQLTSNPPGAWSPSSIIDPSGTFNPSNLSPGEYTVTVSAGSTDCPNSEETSFTILENFSIAMESPPEACDEAIVTPASLNLDVNGVSSYSWTFVNGSMTSFNGMNFPAVTFSQSGSITLVANGDCGSSSQSVDVNVVPNTGVDFGNNPDTLCSTSSPIQLEASPDGNWSSPNLPSSALSNDGLLDPVNVAADIYTLIFTPNGDCVDPDEIQIEIIPSANVQVEDLIICIDSDPITLSAEPSGGIWQGTGVTDPSAGIFDPSNLDPGSYTIEYTFMDNNNCSIIKDAEVLVEALPIISMEQQVQLCLSDVDVNLVNVLSYTVDPEDGASQWSGPGIIDDAGIFNSQDASLDIGTYEVFVTYTRNDCVVSDTVNIELIEDEPLTVSPNMEVCINDETLQLVANLQGGTWTGPQISAQGLINLTTAGDGNFTYTYSFAPGTSCAQTATTQVEIIDLSTIIDAGPDKGICDGPTSFTFENASPENGTWDGFGIDPTTGIIDLSQHQLDSVYTYTYCIESNAVADCQACDNRDFIIHSNPVSSFEIDGLPCINETFQLLNTSTIASDDLPLSFVWDFGDGSPTSTMAEPSHTYTSPGTYTISLTSTSTEDCPNTISQAFEVTTKPTATFDIVGETEGCAPFLVQVNNMSFGDGITQSWCIAGDTIFGATLDSFYIDNITTDSVFPIVLKVENVCGPVTDTEEVLVHPYPIVDFGINTDEGCSPLEIDFSNTTLGNPDNFMWSISNGNTYTAFQPPNQILTAVDSMIAIYEVTLYAQNECGDGEVTKDITVFPPEVRAFIEMDTVSGCDPFVVQPKCFATPGALVNWQVFDPNGMMQGSDEKDPTFTLEGPGEHMIVLIATNPECGSHNDTAYVQVLPKPEVAFDHNPWVCIGDTLFMNNTSVAISESTWDYGDGSPTTDQSFHVYDSAGTYTITLTGISSENSCPASISSSIIVRENPIAAFQASQINGCRPLSIDFTNESQNANAYQWNFGDGTSQSSAINPTHLFENAGTFTVTLIVTDEFDCSADSSVFNIIVYELPNSQFEFEEKPYCHRYDSVQLLDQSLDAVAWEWLVLGDTFNTPNPTFLPNEPGMHEIQLTVANDDACEHTSSQFIEVLEAPIANGAALNPLGCQELAVVFDNNSNYSDQYFWDFDNGNSSTDFTPQQVFSDTGTYDVLLVASNLNGCPSDSQILNVTIWPVPVAAFDAVKTEECGTPATVIFENNSIDNPDNDWSFGDGTVLNNVIQAEHSYAAPGDYPVQLIVENSFGCLDTLIKTVEIYGQPEAAFELLTDNVGCDDFTVQIENTSTDALTYQWLVDSLDAINQTSPIFTLTEPGVYDIQLIAAYNENCQDTLVRNAAITVFESPLANFTYEADRDENIIGDVQFLNLSELADRFEWDFGDGQSSNEFAPFHEYDINRAIDVQLTAYNDNGGAFVCVHDTIQAIAPEWITTFYAPNVLSPESGTEEVRYFTPVGVGLQSYEINVYSPWGDLVWRSTTLDNSRPTGRWDGSQNGKALSQGTYVWIAEMTFVNGTQRTKKGTVTILR